MFFGHQKRKDEDLLLQEVHKFVHGKFLLFLIFCMLWALMQGPCEYRPNVAMATLSCYQCKCTPTCYRNCLKLKATVCVIF